MPLDSLVRRILSEDERTRNSDRLLTLEVWWSVSPGSFQKVNDEWFLRVEDFKEHLPMQDTIKRIRAKIQNEEKQFLPTNPQVRDRRQKSKKNAETFQTWQDKYLNN